MAQRPTMLKTAILTKYALSRQIADYPSTWTLPYLTLVDSVKASFIFPRGLFLASTPQLLNTKNMAREVRETPLEDRSNHVLVLRSKRQQSSCMLKTKSISHKPFYLIYKKRSRMLKTSRGRGKIYRRPPPKDSKFLI